MTACNPAATMRHAADHLRDPDRLTVLNPDVADLIADWLDAAALDAEAIGPNPYAERFAAAVLRLPDPYPLIGPPVRPTPEAVVTHVEGVPQ